MVRRSEEFASLGSHGGYTQALTVGKGFSGASRSAAKQASGRSSSGGKGGGGNGTMSAYARHQELIRNYHRYHLNAKVPSSGAIEARGLPGQRRLTDEEALRRQHRFVRDNAEDNRAHEARGLEGAEVPPNAWEVRMAAKYYKLLFKEYALADLSRYREDKVGLRWRTEKDVVSGKGQFECGALRCPERKDLHSYELNFRYKEDGSIKNELVKVRVCPQCARKLFRKKIEALRRQHEQEQEEAERERRRRVKAGLEDGSKKEKKGEPVNEGSTTQESGPPQLPQFDGIVATTGRDASSAGATRESSFSSLSARIGGGGGGNGNVREFTGENGDLALAGEGHELVRQAVAAAGGGANNAMKKRNRPSRWGDKIAPSDSAVVRGGESGLPREMEAGAGAEVGGASISDAASRKAWAGELERDRTAEDEMDDYLSSLLL